MHISIKGYISVYIWARQIIIIIMRMASLIMMNNKKENTRLKMPRQIYTKNKYCHVNKLYFNAHILAILTC